MRMWKRGGYGKGFSQRFGIYDCALRSRLGKRRRIWIHAVSVGEMFVALRFIEELRARRGNDAFVLTTTTSTGHAIAARALGPNDVLLYFPVDIPIIMRYVLRLINPMAIVLVESELWPNLLRLARARKIPVMLLNGRLSLRSYKGYSLLRRWIGDVLQCFTILCAQDEETAERLRNLGAPLDSIKVVGSAKYDVAGKPSADLEPAGRSLLKQAFGFDAKVLVGGSTWSGEEKILIKVFKSLRARHSNARLVLVPRHAERAREVLLTIRESGLSVVRRSALDATDEARAADILLVDTTGELKAFYAAAHLIFVGKSLSSHGGQNIIEPAVFAKTILTGPNMENFAAITADFIAADAVIKVGNALELEEHVIELWDDAEKIAAYGRRAKALVNDKAGAIGTSAELLIKTL